MVKNPPANVGDARDVGLVPGWEDPLQEGMATHSSILAWRIPWTEESAAAAAKSRQSCPTLCNPIDSSPIGSSVPGILQARTLECCYFPLQCRKVKSESEVAQSCRSLSNPMDCSLPGSSVHGILQARVLEWDAIAFSSEILY